MNPHLIRKLFPNASEATLKANSNDYGPGTPEIGKVAAHPLARQPQRIPNQTLELVHQAQESLGARIIVRITCRRVHLQDPDNGLFKPLVDQLRYSGLLPEDDHGTINLETEQIRVATKKEEGTEVEIIYP